jgi:hypothetical protein
MFLGGERRKKRFLGPKIASKGDFLAGTST